MPRPPEAYRRSTLFEALHREMVINEATTPHKKESLKDRITFKGSIKRSIVGLFRTTSQQAYSFDAADSPSSIVIDENGNIKAATLEKLIEKVTTYQYSNVQDIEAFLFSYRAFTTPLRLLELLQSRFTTVIPKDLTTEAEIQGNHEEKQHQFQIRVVRFIKIWFEKLPIDWADQELLLCTASFLKNIVIPSGVSTTADRILKTMEEFKYSPVIVPEDPTTPFDKSTFDFWAFPSEEIARQLTLLEMSNAKLVKPNEFYKQAWTKRDSKKKSPGICNLVKHFNKVTAWVRTEILAQDILKYRVEMVRRFIELSAHLHAMKNMNGLTEIVSALDSTPIQRLTRTWAGLMPQEIAMFEAFRNIISPQRSYAKYREVVRLAEPPFIPYVGVTLADLIFIEEGTPDLVGELCNFQKAYAVASSIRDFMSCQECPYNFTPSPHIQKYIQEFKGFSEDDAYAVSQDIEPRTTLTTSNGSNSSSSSSGSGSGSNSARKHNEALIGEISTTASPPPQQLVSPRHKVSHSDGEVPFLDLRGSVYVKLQLLGASMPITIAFPRDTTAAQALEHLSAHLSGLEETSVFALMPDVLLPEGRVLDKDARLEKYEGKILVILNEPLLIRIGISKNTFLEGIVDVLVDSKAPLCSLVPILLSVFKLETEFSFLYVEGSSSARWLSLNRGLIDQALNDNEGLLLLYPLSNLQNRSAPSLTMTDKSGWLQVKIKSGKKLSITGSGKRQWVVLLDHFLFIYKSPLDMCPKRVVSLENHAVRLERFSKGVHLIITRPNEPHEAPYPTVVLGSAEGSNILYDWLSAMEKTCYHIAGKEHVFGADLSLARGGLPIVVEKCAIFLMAYNVNTKDLFFESGNRAMIEYFKLQFDQGVDVEFTQYNTDAHTVAQLLQLYITQLPAPLLPWGPTLESGGKTEALHAVVAAIDSAYRTVLGVILGLIGTRFLSEEKLEIPDNKTPGDYWRLFLRIPDGLAITLEDEHKAFTAIDGLIMGQDAILVGFKESTISRRLRVKHSARKNAQNATNLTDSPNNSWKIELAHSANSVRHSASKQKTAEKIEEAKARIEEQFGLQRRARAFSDSAEGSPESLGKDSKNIIQAKFPNHSRRYTPKSARASSSSAALPLSSSTSSTSSATSATSFRSSPSTPVTVSRAPSVPLLRLPTSSLSPSPSPSPSSSTDSPILAQETAFSHSLPVAFSVPYISSSPPPFPPSHPSTPYLAAIPRTPHLPSSSPPSTPSPAYHAYASPSESPIPISPLSSSSLSSSSLPSPSSSLPSSPPPSSPPHSPAPLLLSPPFPHKPRALSVPAPPEKEPPAGSVSAPPSPPLGGQSSTISPRAGVVGERNWVRRLTKRGVGPTPDLNWGRACENCGKSFALNGEVACKGCGYHPNQENL